MISEHLDELKHDFKEYIEDIDFKNYNPLSKEAETVINIGLLAMLYEMMMLEHEVKLDSDYERAMSELQSAEKYFNEYTETKDPTLKTMASQECQHASYYINKIRLLDKTQEDKNKFERIKSWYNSLIELINK